MDILLLVFAAVIGFWLLLIKIADDTDRYLHG